MPGLRLLEEGHQRRSVRQRRARRRRLIRRVVAAVVVLAAAGVGSVELLGLGGGRLDAVLGNSSPTTHGHPAAAHTRRGGQPAAAVAKPAPPSAAQASGYGQTLAPAAIRARVSRHLRGSAIERQRLRSGLLFDVRSGEVLWARRPTEELPIASLTKMMTALVVLAHSPPSAPVLITKQAVDFTGSGVGLLPRGKHVSELALLYGLLLPSGNDAAIALAQHVAGRQSAFIELMNARAVAMGLTCTHYTTVSGVIDTGNHSCAVDLAMLAHAVLQNPLLARIVGSSQAVMRFPIKGGKLYLTNNNPLLLAGYPGTDGVKTGYTTKAGMCLVATARRGGRWLGVVLLHSANWLTQGEALLNAGFRATA